MSELISCLAAPLFYYAYTYVHGTAVLVLCHGAITSPQNQRSRLVCGCLDRCVGIGPLLIWSWTWSGKRRWRTSSSSKRTSRYVITEPAILDCLILRLIAWSPLRPRMSRHASHFCKRTVFDPYPFVILWSLPWSLWSKLQHCTGSMLATAYQLVLTPFPQAVRGRISLPLHCGKKSLGACLFHLVHGISNI